MAADKNPFAKFLTHFEKGHVLFHEGDSGEDMFIIQSGKVAIKKRVKDGGDATLAVLEKGDFFGEMALLERLPRSATAEVIEDGQRGLAALLHALLDGHLAGLDDEHVLALVPLAEEHVALLEVSEELGKGVLVGGHGSDLRGV